MLSACSLRWSGGVGQVMVSTGITDALTVPLPCYSRWSQMLITKWTLQPETWYRLKATVLPNLERLIADTAWIWAFCPLLCWNIFLLITGLWQILDSCSLSDIWFINIFFRFDSFKVYNSIMFGIWMSFHFLDSTLSCSTIFLIWSVNYLIFFCCLCFWTHIWEPIDRSKVLMTYSNVSI